MPTRQKRPLPLANGEVYMVDERWFDADPPFMEFYRFKEKDGLMLSGSVYILLEDKRGDLWLTDQEGSNDLIRFDGHEFRYFSLATNASANIGLINCMIENDDGSLWCPHEKGFSRFDPETETFQHFWMEPGLAMGVPDIYFAGRKKTGYFFDTKNNCFVRAFTAEVIDATNPSNRALATFHWLLTKGWRDAKGQIWLNGSTPIGKGLLCVSSDATAVTLYPMKGIVVKDKAGNPEYDPWATVFYADTVRQKIWVSGWRGGLRCFDLNTKQ